MFSYIQCTLPLYYRQHVSYVLQCSNFYSISSKKFCETQSCFMVPWDGFYCKESCAGVSSVLIHRSGDEHCSDWLASFRICMLREGLQEEAWWCGSINSPLYQRLALLLTLGRYTHFKVDSHPIWRKVLRSSFIFLVFSPLCLPLGSNIIWMRLVCRSLPMV